MRNSYLHHRIEIRLRGKQLFFQALVLIMHKFYMPKEQAFSSADFVFKGSDIFFLSKVPGRQHYSIIVDGKSFEYMSSQLDFLSPSAFSNFKNISEIYEVKPPSDMSISIEDIKNCYKHLDSLFSKNTQISFSKNTLPIFQHLTNFLNNHSLELRCCRYYQNEKEYFDFCSNQLWELYQSQLYELNNFTISIGQ
jgi:hypothetical protein